VEPRKNFVAAASIVSALRARGFVDATLDIVGRHGWGNDWEALEAIPGVTLHGYQPDGRVRQILNDADVFICTSHDEGLGLPLLEVQYAGLPVVAPDAPIFHEVLGTSGIFIDPSKPADAADKLTDLLSSSDWRSRYIALADDNLPRWNSSAASDHDAVIGLIARLAGRPTSARTALHDDTIETH